MVSLKYISHAVALTMIIPMLLMASSRADSDTSSLSRNEINLDKILKINEHPDKPFSFVVLGDSRSNPDIFARIADLINSLEPDFVLHLGDIAINGLTSEFDEVMPIFDKVKSPLIAVIGNHDLSDGRNIKSNFYKYFGQCELTFDVHNIRFILADNSLGYLKKSQCKRIRKDLDTGGTRMLFMHAPPDGPYPKHNFEGGARELVDTITDTGCEYAFFSHIHGYDHRMIGKNCHAYITGGGGAELNGYGIAAEIHHVLLVTVSGNNINVRMIPLSKE
ncbi:metallophosphoesterase [bacterium]|nr:metallophosphoesterase [bacterium]